MSFLGIRNGTSRAVRRGPLENALNDVAAALHSECEEEACDAHERWEIGQDAIKEINSAN